MAQLTTTPVQTRGGVGEVLETDFIRVVFQSGFPREVGINGCRVEDVIKLAAARLNQYQNGPLACEENDQALICLTQAVNALEERLQRRREQGVFNTMVRHETHRTEDLDPDFSATGA